MISKVRGWLYKTAKLLGDIQAVKRGPKAILKRVGRRVAGRAFSRVIGRLFPPR